jgi:RND superfamily putative drug exporter
MLAGTFATLIVLPVWLLFEIGFAIALGVVINTFVACSLLVPAVAWLVDECSWWPDPQASCRPLKWLPR